MIFSGGDQNKIEKAKQMFGQIIIGLAVILLSYILVTLAQSVFTT
jgi:VIT1/CCC1 family predicted Fe2+/Mn2+ transporter